MIAHPTCRCFARPLGEADRAALKSISSDSFVHRVIFLGATDGQGDHDGLWHAREPNTAQGAQASRALPHARESLVDHVLYRLPSALDEADRLELDSQGISFVREPVGFALTRHQRCDTHEEAARTSYLLSY